MPLVGLGDGEGEGLGDGLGVGLGEGLGFLLVWLGLAVGTCGVARGVRRGCGLGDGLSTGPSVTVRDGAGDVAVPDPAAAMLMPRTTRPPTTANPATPAAIGIALPLLDRCAARRPVRPP